MIRKIILGRTLAIEKSGFYRLITIGFISVAIAGCMTSAVRGGPVFQMDPPLPEKAVIYHYRTYSMGGSGVKYDVMSNGKPLTRIGNSGFYKETLDPGETLYVTKTSRSISLMWYVDLVANATADFIDAYSITVEPGEVYFLKWSPHGEKPIIEEKSQAEALPEISKLKVFPQAQ